MAIKLSKELPSGEMAEYWRIMMVVADYASSHIFVTLGAYKDHDARVAGKAPVEHDVHRIAYVSGLDDRAAIYAALKLLPSFTGAIDA